MTLLGLFGRGSLVRFRIAAPYCVQRGRAPNNRRLLHEPGNVKDLGVQLVRLNHGAGQTSAQPYSTLAVTSATSGNIISLVRAQERDFRTALKSRQTNISSSTEWVREFNLVSVCRYDLSMSMHCAAVVQGRSTIPFISPIYTPDLERSG